MPAAAGSSAARYALADELIGLLPALKRRFQGAMPQALRDDLGATTPHQMEALHLLHLTRQHDEGEPGATMNELARRQGCAMSTATALADRLLRQGLVERVPDAADRRVVRITPTVKGQQLCEQFTEARRNLALGAMEALTDDEIRDLICLVRKLAGAALTEATLEEVER